ncbi:hypothetical protein C8Q74DRAFT_1374140 [Fomes fomentarius]|nr:hypothetical protein C8Q74DRAFT_1374140 [Fomes fomentarius]
MRDRSNLSCFTWNSFSQRSWNSHRSSPPLLDLASIVSQFQRMTSRRVESNSITSFTTSTGSFSWSMPLLGLVGGGREILLALQLEIISYLKISATSPDPSSWGSHPGLEFSACIHGFESARQRKLASAVCDDVVRPLKLFRRRPCVLSCPTCLRLVAAVRRMPSWMLSDRGDWHVLCHSELMLAVAETAGLAAGSVDERS